MCQFVLILHPSGRRSASHPRLCRLEQTTPLMFPLRRPTPKRSRIIDWPAHTRVARGRTNRRAHDREARPAAAPEERYLACAAADCNPRPFRNIDRGAGVWNTSSRGSDRPTIAVAGDAQQWQNEFGQLLSSAPRASGVRYAARVTARARTVSCGGCRNRCVRCELWEGLARFFRIERLARPSARGSSPQDPVEGARAQYKQHAAAIRPNSPFELCSRTDPALD